jgi:cyclopropane-fatty-acyl-phospholipid synthase
MTRSRSMDTERDMRPGLAGRILQQILGRIRHGRITLEIDGVQVTLKSDADGPDAHMALHRPWHFLRQVWLHGALGVGESYLAGDWDSDDLSNLLECLALNEPWLGRPSRPNPFARLWVALEHARHGNTRRGSRRNIQAHYDLGNAFYREWLDGSMTYSSAVFDYHDESLSAAQLRKYHYILDRLDIKPDDRLLEIGCGWGGLAIEAARRGARVTGLTLSHEQLDYARRRVTELGLEHRIEIRLQDYRDVHERFDHVVSIEMFEAVGKRYWPVYFNAIAQALKPGGSAALQVITIDEAWYAQYVKTPDFIQRHIFPGGMLPTVERFTTLAEQAGLHTESPRFFGEHYAQTLKRWHQRFLAALGRIDELGYDRRFQRIWRYYLSYCEAGFRMGRVDLMQTTLRKPAGSQ